MRNTLGQGHSIEKDAKKIAVLQQVAATIGSPGDHGALSGLGDDDHTQYLRADGGRTLTGNLPVNPGVTIDGVDLSAHAANASAHHAPVTAGNGILVTGQQVSVGAGAGITVNVSDVALTTPGTLTVASTNTAVGSHTHAVTSSSNPGAGAALLATNASGYLQLDRLGIGVAPTAKLNVDATGAVIAGIVVKTDLNQNYYQYLKPDGTNLFRAAWDTSALQHYLNGALQYNLSGNSVIFDGNSNTSSKLRITGGTGVWLDDSPTPTTWLLWCGAASYATAGSPLSSIRPLLVYSYAWNGSNGSSIYSFSQLKQTQVSTTTGDARLDILNTASTAVLSLKLLSGNVGINTTTPEEKLDVNGNLQMRGNIVPRTTAAHDLGSITKLWNKAYLGELWSSVLVGSTPYASRATGWQVNAAGEADFRNIFADSLEVQTFITDNVIATAGTTILTKSRAILSRDYVSQVASNTLYVYDLPGSPDTPVFASDDVVSLRFIDRSTGIVVGDVLVEVSNYTDLPDGEQSWTADLLTGTVGKTIYTGTIALDYGTSGDGFILSTAVGSYAPYMDVRTWAGSPSTDTTHLRLGKLQGITAVSEFGLYAGISVTQKLIASDGRLELHGAKFSLYSGATEVMRLDPAVPSLAMGASLPAYGGTGVWMGLHSGAYKFRAGDANDYVHLPGHWHVRQPNHRS
jgi:hypothetical protein